MIIFASNNSLEVLQNSEDWFCDFQGLSRSILSVIFVILHARVDGRVIPCVFALLLNKTGATYTRIFNQLSDHVNQVGIPSTLLFDFELGAINAVANTFLGVEIKGTFAPIYERKSRLLGFRIGTSMKPSFLYICGCYLC